MNDKRALPTPASAVVSERRRPKGESVSSGT